MKQFTFFFFFMLIAHLAFTQSGRVTGLVTDESGEAIPFAHVRIKSTYSGTLTNINGRFQLNIPNINETQLFISCVGFESKTVDVPTNGMLKISLREDLIELGEVVVVPKDYARELVRDAIQKIPDNYPLQNEIMTGFIRETLSKDSLADSLYYISEAQTEASKSPYDRASSSDEVKIIKGRKLDVDTDNLAVRIYAGAHLQNRFDMVLKREGPLNSGKMKNFIYEIDDTVRFNGKKLFKVGYVSRDGNESGEISILDQSLAIVHLEQYQSKGHFKGANLIKANKRQYLKSVTSYDIHEDSLWRLNYIRYGTKFKNGSVNIYLNSTYSTHGFRKEKEKIPYNERIQFGDYLYTQVDEFDPAYWDDYNVTVADRRFDEAYVENVEADDDNSEKVSKRSKILNLIQRLELGYALRGMKTKISNHTINFNNGEIALDETIAASEDTRLALALSLMYRIKERSYLIYESSMALDGSKSTDLFLGYSYRMPIGKSQRTFFAGSVGYVYSELNQSLGSVSLTSNTKLDGRKIDADVIDIYSAAKHHSILSSLSVIYEKSRRLKFHAGIEYLTVMDQRDGLRIIEDQWFLKRKNIFIKEGDEGLTINSSESSNFERSVGFRAGIILAF